MLLGHVGPHPSELTLFTPSSLVTEASLDPFSAVLIVGAATLYVLGIRRLAARGRRWSGPRTAAFFGGLALLAIATQSGLAAYENSLFSAHAAQHVLIGMAAPLFLALGAPITLALQACSRSRQVTLLRGLRSRPVRWATQPIVALLLFALSLFVLYLTPIYELSVTNDVVHIAVHTHFLLAGSIFYWAVIGLDPVSWRIPFGIRLGLVLLTIPFHSFLALALMSGTEPVAAEHYASIPQPTSVSAMDDQRMGAGIMWVAGDILGLVVAGVVVIQWMTHEDRATRRRDAIEDRQLADRYDPAR